MPALALGAVLLGTGCGVDAVLWGKVGAPLVCPAAGDRLQLQVTLADGTPLLTQEHDLRSRVPSFPQSASFSAEDERYLGAPGLRISAAIFQGDALAAPWSQGSAGAVLEDGQVTSVLLTLEAPR